MWYNHHTFPWCTKHLIWFVCTLNLSITQGSLTDTPMSVKTWYLPNRALMITYKIQHTTKDHSCWNSRKCLSTRVFTLISKLMQIDYTIEHCRVYHILPVIGNWCGFLDTFFDFLDTFITYVYKSSLYSAHLETNTIQFTSMNLKINAYFCKLRCIFLPILTLFGALKRNKIHYRVRRSVWEFLPVYQQSTWYYHSGIWSYNITEYLSTKLHKSLYRAVVKFNYLTYILYYPKTNLIFKNK